MQAVYTKKEGRSPLVGNGLPVVFTGNRTD